MSRHFQHVLRPGTVCVRGRRYAVRSVVSVGGRQYGLIECLSRARDRHLAFDPSAGPDGDLRAIHFYPNAADTAERLRVLKRLSEEDSRLPTVISYHVERDRLAVVLQWRWGVGLDRYLEDVRTGRSPRPLMPTALRILRNLAHAVGKLNSRLNIIHGDIKPANIVSPADSTNVALIDFGSAWCVERTVAEAGGGDGVTPDVYAAPEQRIPGPPFPDFRSDVFSVSVIAYELMTGRIPYDGLGGGAGATAELRRAYEPTFVPPSRLKPPGDPTPADLWRRADRMLTRGLHLDPAGRYPNREEWLGDIDDLHAAVLQKPALNGPAKLVLGVAGAISGVWKKYFGR